MPYSNQFQFQHAHAVGRILNVGSHADTSGLRAHRGAVNVDLFAACPFTGAALPVDILADARDLPSSLHGQFDTVVLGDILEHFVRQEDAIDVLLQAKRCLRPGGRILITAPEDHRGDVEGQNKMYTPEIYGYHAYPVTRQMVEGWCFQAGLHPVLYEHIDYPFTEQGGHGVVASVASLSSEEGSLERTFQSLGLPTERIDHA